MTSNNNNTASANINLGWLGLLGVILVVLKLNPGDYLDSPVEGWSWWLVTLPFWGGMAIVLLILLGVGIVFLVAFIKGEMEIKKNRKTRAKRDAEMREKRKNKGITNF